MRSRTPDTVCVLDLGSSKVVCLIGRQDDNGTQIGFQCSIEIGKTLDIEHVYFINKEMIDGTLKAGNDLST